jgi:preprotein translocase subunit SecA
VEDIVATHATGQPVLVGTITIDGSEEISNLLRKQGIKHNVLNAKFHEQEAQIVADAGERGAVTIATNMAGRGTDIKLGEGVAELGGLKIIGTERHEARRIDNQLRGRAGRQGDPGDTRFYISLEDDLMRLFGSDKMMKVFNTLAHEDGMAIEHKMLSNAVEKAQKKIESNNFGIRKNLLEYDQVINEQRELIYEERRRVLKGESMREEILRMIGNVMSAEISGVIEEGEAPADWNLELLNRTILPIAPIRPLSMNHEDYQGYTRQKLIDEVTEKVKDLYAAKEKEIEQEVGTPEAFREAERVFLLKVIDNKWMNHIDDMDQLRQGIALQAYAQKDPVVEYRYAGIEMFEEMIASVSKDIVTIMLHIRKKPETEREQVAKVTGTNKDDSSVRQPVRRSTKKVSPNDPCPCGKCYPDGKPIKYKNCCGRNK